MTPHPVGWGRSLAGLCRILVDLRRFLKQKHVASVNRRVSICGD